MINYFKGKTFINRISLNDTITNETKIIFESKLKNIKTKTAKALFIDINLKKSSISQCELISNQIIGFKKENPSIPIYTFAEELILGPSIIPLLTGDYVYAEQNSWFGLYDFFKFNYNFKKYIEDNNYKVKLNTIGKNKIRLNPLEQWKEEDFIWLKQMLDKLKEILVDKVYEIRKMKNSKITKDQVKDFLDSGLKS